MKYDIVQSASFKKDLKKVAKRGYLLDELDNIVSLLANGDTIPEKYRDHPLRKTNEYRDCRELHINPDWLLVYKYYDKEVILLLLRTGTHSDLF